MNVLPPGLLVPAPSGDPASEELDNMDRSNRSSRIANGFWNKSRTSPMGGDSIPRKRPETRDFA